MIKIDPEYRPNPIERKDVFGITFEQGRNEVKLNGAELFENIPTQNKNFPEAAKRDLMIALITLKYTQSNSVCYVKDGQAIGIGAGQQSRIHCTRLAGNKADIWYLRQHPKVLNLPWVERSVVPIVIIPSIFILAKIMMMYWLMEYGSSSLLRNLKY